MTLIIAAKAENGRKIIIAGDRAVYERVIPEKEIIRSKAEEDVGWIPCSKVTYIRSKKDMKKIDGIKTPRGTYGFGISGMIDDRRESKKLARYEITHHEDNLEKIGFNRTVGLVPCRKGERSSLYYINPKGIKNLAAGFILSGSGKYPKVLETLIRNHYSGIRQKELQDLIEKAFDISRDESIRRGDPTIDGLDMLLVTHKTYKELKN